MTSKTVFTLNTLSGRVGVVPAIYLDDPQFGAYLVKVPEGTKDYDPEFFKPGTASEHVEKETSKRKAEKLNDKRDKSDELDLGF